MNTHVPFKRIAAAGLGAVLLAAGANALADPPSRVARLAYISGPVSFAPAGDNAWEYASLNHPLIPGDRLWVEPGARDEVQVGGAALRMGPGTLATLLNLDDRITQLQLSQGRLNVRVRRLGPNDIFEIDTPNLALSIRTPGDYRIEVDPAGNTTMVAVRRGQAEAYGEGNAYRLDSGQAFSFAGTDLRSVQYAQPNLDDDFDRWSAARDRRIEQARSARYVSPNLVGYEDLDEQGSWRTVPSYGNVWMPEHVGRDWAPYRDGHWSYVQPWGWTWVDDAPWGFAVSHYGRWARFPEGWGWVPGPRTVSPVYAPALVAFISIGSGAYAPRERPVAWFPLAPSEVYRPSYRASTTYITNINITNTTIDRRHVERDDRRVDYANRRVSGAVTAVPAAAFVRAQPVSKAALAIPAAALARAPVAPAAPVAPERDGMRGRGNPGHQPPPAVMARQALAKTPPPPALRHAPSPDMNRREPANLGPQAAQAAGPAPRVLAQDRNGAARQLRPVPALPPVQGAVPPPLAHAPTPAQASAPATVPAPQREHGRNGTPPARLERGPTPLPPANAPAPVASQAPQHEQGRNRVPQLERGPTPVPPANVPAPVASQAPQREQGRNRAPQLERGPTPVPQLERGPTPVPPANALAPAPVASQGPQREQGRNRAPQLERGPTPVPSPQANAPAPAPVAAPALQREHGRDRTPPPPLERAPAPAPVPPPLAHAPAPVPAPAAPQRERGRDGTPSLQRAPAPMPPPLAHAPTPMPPPPPPHAAPAATQHAAPPAPPPPPAPARPPEPPRLRHAPVPAPAPKPAEPPRPEQARAAPAASQAGQPGHGNEGKKDDKRHPDRPEQQ
jgi:hypothetical protein